MKDPPRGQSDGSADAAPPRRGWSDYGVLLHTPSWVYCTLGMTAMTFSIGGIAFWMPYYLAGKPGAPASATVIFGAVTCVAGLVATLAGGIVGDRLRARFPGSYFLVSGIAMLAGFPVPAADAARAVSHDLDLALHHLLLPLLQHRADEHDPRQRQPPVDPRGRLRAQHLRHPRLRRRDLARRHRHRRRPVRHEPRVHPRRRDVRRRRHPLAARRAAPAARHRAGGDAARPPARMTQPDRGGLGYRFVRGLTRLLLDLFYARVEVVGVEHVPATGPLIVAANHHNSIVDAMLLLVAIPRPVRTLANAPLFRHPLIGPFLHLIGALPVHRRQEAGNDPARNAALFAATTAALSRGGRDRHLPGRPHAARARPPGDSHRHGAHASRRRARGRRRPARDAASGRPRLPGARHLPGGPRARADRAARRDRRLPRVRGRTPRRRPPAS